MWQARDQEVLEASKVILYLSGDLALLLFGQAVGLIVDPEVTERDFCNILRRLLHETRIRSEIDRGKSGIAAFFLVRVIGGEFGKEIVQDRGLPAACAAIDK